MHFQHSVVGLISCPAGLPPHTCGDLSGRQDCDGRSKIEQAAGKAATKGFKPGDIGYVKRSNGHYIEVFRTSYFADVSLSDWLTHTPAALVARHLNVDLAAVAKFPADKPEVMPE